MNCCSASDRRKTAIGICRACRRSDFDADDQRQAAAIQCTVDGMTIGKRLQDDASCPLGRWPDADGLVRWLGMRWHGVPMPVRLVLAVRLYPGCGCIVPMKAAWKRLRSWWRVQALQRSLRR